MEKLHCNKKNSSYTYTPTMSVSSFPLLHTLNTGIPNPVWLCIHHTSGFIFILLLGMHLIVFWKDQCCLWFLENSQMIVLSQCRDWCLETPRCYLSPELQRCYESHPVVCPCGAGQELFLLHFSSHTHPYPEYFWFMEIFIMCH